MVGIVVVTHNAIGRTMVQTVEEILKQSSPLVIVEIEHQTSLLESQKKIHDALEKFHAEEGIVILTDLFGATPSNLCKEYLINGKVEMVTGMNLPMLLKAATTTFKDSPAQVAQFLKNYGTDNIRVYSTDY